MYAKIYIWAKWDLGTLGESIRFCKFIQILFQIGWLSLNGTAMQLDIEALHVTYYTVNMADCSSPFKRSVITTYHHSLSTVYQMHWYQIGQ